MGAPVSMSNLFDVFSLLFYYTDIGSRSPVLVHFLKLFPLARKKKSTWDDEQEPIISTILLYLFVIRKVFLKGTSTNSTDFVTV
jgi:hypothetical protein